jgi:tRNA (guanine-N7-)-methyltransferase
MGFGLAHGRELDTTGYGLTQADLPPFEVARPEACRIDPRTWFEHPGRPLEIEIGSGKGTFLVQQAATHPEVNYLGIEHAGEFYRFAADRLRRRGMVNARVLHTDAAAFLHYWCPDAVARVIHLYFSDPWPKKRHHKRRVVQDASLRDMHRALAPGGELRLVTDHDDLWAWYEVHASRCADLFERCAFAGAESAGGGELVGTNYERKFAREGRPFHAMTLLRRDRPAPGAADQAAGPA